MANYEATKYDFSGANLTGIQGVNTGLIIPWGDSNVPSGFLECNGQAVSQATYADLFAVIGTTYGDPGGGNFNVPDLQDKVVQGRSPGSALGTTTGANETALSGNVTGNAGNTTLSTPTIASHSHSFYGNLRGALYTNYMQHRAVPTVMLNTGNSGGHSHSIGGNVSGNYSTLQPYLTIMYIIKT